MTPATNWLPGIVVLVAALVVGTFVLLKSRAGAPLPPPARTRREELQAQKDAIYALLADHAAVRGTLPDADWTAERDRLELEAARVLREIDLVADDAAPAPTPRAPSFGQRNPKLVGALYGGGAVLFAGALALTLQEYSRPRAEGGSMTGSDAVQGDGSAQGGGQQLTPQQEAFLAQLRAEVAAKPDDADARNRLGHALLHAGQLMDSFNEAEAVVKLRPEDAEARTHQAIVLVAIGDLTTAASALDKVIATAPNFAEALAYRGALHLQAGEAEPAVTLLERAVANDPNLLESVQPLIDAAKSGNLPSRAPAAEASTGAGGPMSGGSGAGERAPSAQDVTGTIAVDPAVADRAKPGDTLFLSARAAGVTGGPPTWVRRIPVTSFPLEFSLGPNDAMMQGAAPPAEVVITARIDKDGNPTTKSAEDLEGKTAAVAPGTNGVTITLAAAQP